MTIRPIHKFKEAAKYYALGLYNGLDDDHCFLFASGIAYNVILCIIPLSLILFQAFTFILRNNVDAQAVILQYIKSSLPVAGYSGAVEEWVQGQFSHVVDMALIPAIIALVILLWLSSALFSSLRTALNAIFKIKPKQNIAILKLLDIGMIFFFTLFLLLTLTINPLIGVMREFGDKILPQSVSEYLQGTIAYVIPIATTAIVFLLLFKTIPNEKIQWRVVILSTIVTVILLELMRKLFLIYLSYISSIGAVYGAYAFLVAVALWAYYGALAFLIGAEIGKLYRNRILQVTVAEVVDPKVI